ncbi:hypothetical protein NIES37_19940 [Tolypothrix tenuis PCC 7101]|uniref:Ppx/GppA phosphatase N-terminal domain-containing protein n=1 Tax=Tolypothrix tenuis PCC 7101 TaxID=231146 RepID=A0A1Z4MX25_9CYAN|nr:hypothetical protein [Aulosira sp. FACHB-113]BAY98046.1 hypothetical protein NIES37_19940 [Tolypothrix tenuis PCC 7101]BAZ78035.1 hypothetical protein NIES50_66680 [Aulosira laxa NIES-50]
MQQNKWMCNGIVENGQQHPNQELQGIYKPYNNYGNDCVISHLTQEQVVGDASKSPFKASAISLLAGILAASGVGCRAVVSSSSPNPSASASASPSKETGNQCSTDKLVKKSGNLFGAIEVGGKGVKGKVIQELATLNEDGAKLVVFRKEKIEDRNVNAPNPDSKLAAVKAVKSTFQDIQKRFNISCEQIVIYGSSGFVQDAPAPHREVIAQEVRQATGRTMKFITSEEEASFGFDGVVPAWRLNETIVVDIGSSNTKGAYLDSNNKHITFSFPFGTGRFTREVKKSQGNIDFTKAAENLKQKKLIPQIASEVQLKPGMQTLPRVYLAGGISWALSTLTRPCSKKVYTVAGKNQERLDSFVPISSEDIKTFYYNATQDKKALFNPDLSNCSTERREEVQKDIAKIQTGTFSEDELIAGSEILRAFNQELNWSGKQVFFVPSAKDALPIGYLQQQLKKVEEDADQ